MGATRGHPDPLPHGRGDPRVIHPITGGGTLLRGQCARSTRVWPGRPGGFHCARYPATRTQDRSSEPQPSRQPDKAHHTQGWTDPEQPPANSGGDHLHSTRTSPVPPIRSAFTPLPACQGIFPALTSWKGRRNNCASGVAGLRSSASSDPDFSRETTPRSASVSMAVSVCQGGKDALTNGNSHEEASDRGDAEDLGAWLSQCRRARRSKDPALSQHHRHASPRPASAPCRAHRTLQPEELARSEAVPGVTRPALCRAHGPQGTPKS